MIRRRRGWGARVLGCAALGALLASVGCGVKSRPQPPASRLLHEVATPPPQIPTH